MEQIFLRNILQKSLIAEFKECFENDKVLSKYFSIATSVGFVTTRDNIFDMKHDKKCKRYLDSVWFALLKNFVTPTNCKPTELKKPQQKWRILNKEIEKILYEKKITKDAYERIRGRWEGIKKRVSGRDKDSKFYIEKGIKNNFADFYDFVKWFIAECERQDIDIGFALSSYDVDRIDSNGHYCWENCQLLERHLNQSKVQFQETRHIMFDNRYIPVWVFQHRMMDIENDRVMSRRIADFENGKTRSLTPFMIFANMSDYEIQRVMLKAREAPNSSKDFFKLLMQEYPKVKYMFYDYHKNPIKLTENPVCPDCGKKIGFNVHNIDGFDYGVIECFSCGFKFVLSCKSITGYYYIDYFPAIEKCMMAETSAIANMKVYDTQVKKERNRFSCNKQYYKRKQQPKTDEQIELDRIKQREAHERCINKKRAEQGLPPKKIEPYKETPILELKTRKAIRVRLKKDLTLDKETIQKALERMKELQRVEKAKYREKLGEEVWREMVKKDNAQRLAFYRENKDDPRTKRRLDSCRKYRQRRKVREEKQKKLELKKNKISERNEILESEVIGKGGIGFATKAFEQTIIKDADKDRAMIDAFLKKNPHKRTEFREF